MVDLKSGAGRLEQLNEIAGGIDEHALRSTGSDHDVIAEGTPAAGKRATSAAKSSTSAAFQAASQTAVLGACHAQGLLRDADGPKTTHTTSAKRLF
jgi:hypothetical protein